jgi:hypothetical protein
VADFGLVRLAPADGKCVSVETRLAGTFGYLAPEYAGDHPIFLHTKYAVCSVQLISTLHLTYSYL